MTTAFSEQLVALRPNLLRIARRRVRNEAWADDAVSETLLAALEKPAAFEGRAQLQTWLVGVLKHKLVDQTRRHTREQAFTWHGEEDGDGLGDGNANANAMSDVPADSAWADPQASLQQRQFMQRCDAMLQRLPAQHGMAFVLRDCLECETDEVCQEMGITATNLSVILYRARRRMRDFMQTWHCPAPLG